VVKPTLASRRARIARVEAKRPPAITVTMHATPSNDLELLRRFDHWLQKLLLEPATPDKSR